MNITEIKYKTTKEECQRSIDEDKFVCPGCGGPITPFETVDNSGDPTYWPGCEHCQQFTHGFPPHVFQIASIMVKEHYHQPYSHIQRPYNGTEKEMEEFYESQTRKTCSEVSLVLKLSNEIQYARG